MGSIKRFDIQHNLKRFNIDFFVETGTWRGDGLAYAAKFDFQKLYSIEIMPEIASESRQRFSNDKRIEIFTGSSTVIFPELLKEIEGNILFWLDAHYPGAEEGLKDYNAHAKELERLPLETELELLKEKRPRSSDLIIIDDLRIYEDGPFESGNLPSNINKNIRRDLDFIESLYGKSHNIKKFYANEGYIVIEPRNMSQRSNNILASFNKKFRHKIY